MSGTENTDMSPAISRISEFYRFQEHPCTEETYLVLDTGKYISYAFRPAPRAIQWLVDRIGHSDWKTRLGVVALKTGSLLPRVLPFVPMIRSEVVAAPVDRSFDIAVIGDRITMFDFDADKVCTIAINDRAKLRREIERRKRLPDSINTVPIVEHDIEYPYIVEEFLDGRELADPVSEWRLLLDAIEQLTALYRTERERVKTSTVLRSLRERLTLQYGSDPVVRVALELLASLELPPTLYRGPVHGDLHAGNVFVSESVYLLDWEDIRTDYLLDDFFRPFVIQHYNEPMDHLFVEMIEGRSTGGRIAADYAQAVGPLAYGESNPYAGLPLLYLLLLLDVSTPNGSLREPCRELLSGVVAELRSAPSAGKGR